MLLRLALLYKRKPTPTHNVQKLAKKPNRKRRVKPVSRRRAARATHAQCTSHFVVGCPRRFGGSVPVRDGSVRPIDRVEGDRLRGSVVVHSFVAARCVVPRAEERRRQAQAAIHERARAAELEARQGECAEAMGWTATVAHQMLCYRTAEEAKANQRQMKKEKSSG